LFLKKKMKFFANINTFFFRFGKKFGFNFNEHHRDKVGVLRAFVKKKKKESESQKREISNVIISLFIIFF
jgi:hypothetical protein